MLCDKYLVAVSKNAKKFAPVRHSSTIVRSKASDLRVERFVQISAKKMVGLKRSSILMVKMFK